MSDGAKKSNLLLHLAKSPQRPHLSKLDTALQMLAEAETGDVSAFAWCAVGPQFSTWWSITSLTRDQRMNLIGQLSMMIRVLENEELELR